MGTLLQDLRYGLRMLAKNPSFTVVAVLSLALGIGATSAIFSVINAVMYRPLPYPHPDRLVVIAETKRGDPHFQEAPPIAEVVDWRKQNHAFEGIALTSDTEEQPASGIGEPQPIRVQWVTPNFFELLGVRPILGRVFFASEMQDRSQTILISTPFWKSHFHSDRRVLGRSIDLGGVVSTIVGIMPPSFTPFYGQPIDVWEPINPASPRYSARMDHWLTPVARLKSGVTLAQAQTEADLIARRLELAYPKTNKGTGRKVTTLRQALYGGAGRTLYPILGAVGFVLLIGCLNVGSLLQCRAETRRKEFAVRASLGAGRRRLVQQLFAETGILAFLGGCLGVGLSVWGIRIFLTLAGDFPNANSITVDGSVLLFTLGISVLSVIVIGLAPAIQAGRPDLNRALREGDRRTTGGSRGRARHVLVVGEIGLSLVLLVGAGLMVNTMLRLERVNPGFDPTNVLTMGIVLPEGGKYLTRVPGGDMEKTLPPVNAFHRELLEKISGLPGVASVGIVSGVPTHWSEPRTFAILGQPAPPSDKRPETEYDEVSPGCFRTLRVPLKEGRYLDEHDTESAPWVAVVNEAFARRYFPKQDPVGQQILMRYVWSVAIAEPHPREIVGVVGDVKQFGLAGPSPPFVYASYFQQPEAFPGGTAVTHLRSDLVIRTKSSLSLQESALIASVKKIVEQLDPNQPVTDVMTMDQVLKESTGYQQFYMELLGIFAALAVGLALIGIYGVMSYFVADRTNEIGIRIALGAQRTDVLRLVMGQGLRLALIGVAAGVVGALALTRFLSNALYGVKAIDPLTFAAVSVLLMITALLACYLPARRATRVDPMVALRYE